MIGYVRVSSHDQKSDLVQEKALAEKCKPIGIVLDRTIQNIGSGKNYKKKGFRQLMTMLLSGKIRRIVVMHKDRLLRFGSEIIFLICKAMNVEVTILEESPAKSPVEALCLDLVEIMTVFTNKIYGMRSRSNLKSLNPSLLNKYGNCMNPHKKLLPVDSPEGREAAKKTRETVRANPQVAEARDEMHHYARLMKIAAQGIRNGVLNTSLILKLCYISPLEAVDPPEDERALAELLMVWPHNATPAAAIAA